MPKGSKCIGKDIPQAALSVVPDALRPDDTFAVIFSLSHVISDGYTHYKILSMLSSDGEITSMNPTRKQLLKSAAKRLWARTNRLVNLALYATYCAVSCAEKTAH